MDRDAELQALRTQVANQAASLAQTVTEGFEGFEMGAGAWTVELAAPEGPSTGGGAQARQPLRLVPKRSGYPTIVVGSIDPVSSTGELRTFGHVAILHELRFDAPLAIGEDEYAEFLRKASVVMNLARVGTKLTPPSPDLVAQRAARKRSSVPLVFVVLAIVAVVIAAVSLVIASR